MTRAERRRHHRKYMKKYRRKNRAKLLKQRKVCRNRKSAKLKHGKCVRQWYRKNKPRLLKKARTYRKQNVTKIRTVQKVGRLKLRLEILTHYGLKCICCSESHINFLSIDHIDNNGNKHRKTVGSGSQFYYWVRRNKFPKDLQILCFNCNMSKGFYGVCPHKTKGGK